MKFSKGTQPNVVADRTLRCAVDHTVVKVVDDLVQVFTGVEFVDGQPVRRQVAVGELWPPVNGKADCRLVPAQGVPKHVLSTAVQTLLQDGVNVQVVNPTRTALVGGQELTLTVVPRDAGWRPTSAQLVHGGRTAATLVRRRGHVAEWMSGEECTSADVAVLTVAMLVDVDPAMAADVRTVPAAGGCRATVYTVAAPSEITATVTVHQDGAVVGFAAVTADTVFTTDELAGVANWLAKLAKGDEPARTADPADTPAEHPPMAVDNQLTKVNEPPSITTRGFVDDAGVVWTITLFTNGNLALVNEQLAMYTGVVDDHGLRFIGHHQPDLSVLRQASTVLADRK